MSTHKKKKMTLASIITFNILLLGYFKYANFFLENINALAGTEYVLKTVLLPLGISFFTFQQIAYAMDAYREKAKVDSLLEYAVFVSFFPQLISGPITHYKEIFPQFVRKNICFPSSKNIALGLTILVIGFFKKTVLADSIAPFADAVFLSASEGNALTFYEAWGGALSYTMQLYFDFSGYIDMALGIALLFGIQLPLNFQSPYKAASIVDFWRRWHITLSNFLRDYIYFSLGGNRKGKVRQKVNLLITMLLGGLWHGAGWTFIVWGGLHGTFLVINHTWRSVMPSQNSSGVLIRTSSWLLTFLCIVVGWVFFRAPTLEAAFSMLSSMTDVHSLSPAPYVQELLWWWDKSLAGIRIPEWTYGIVWLLVLSVIAFFFPNTSEIMKNHLTYADEKQDTPFAPSVISLRWKPGFAWAAYCAVLTVIAVSFLALYQERVFVYFQF